MTTNELRFPAPGARFYVSGISLSIIGLALIAWGVVILAFDPWNWPEAIFLLGGIFVAVLGAVFCSFVWFTLAWGTFTTWRNWRQLRAPSVIIDATGVRYLASRRPTAIPWSDIEQLGVRRSIFRNHVVTKIFLRLMPSATLLRDGIVPANANRYLNIGLASDLPVPEETAVRFLQETAGSRLKVTEVNRRTPETG